MMINHMFKRYCCHIGGNFAILGSLTILALLTGVGAAFDISEMTHAKARLQDSVDTASLAGAVIARRDQINRRSAADRTLKSNIALHRNMELFGSPSIVFNDATREIEVRAKVKYHTRFANLLGVKTITLEAQSITGFAIEEVAPLSIMLVLDASGSMDFPSSDGVVKIEALKSAVEDMFDTLYDTSESPELLMENLRSGYVSYETGVRSNWGMRSGYSSTVRYTRWMRAKGGTNSAPALSAALSRMQNEKASNDSSWAGYVIFMTDGDNNDPASDTASLATCKDIRDAGIQIYTVAFEAPAKGADLLKKCAVEKSHYFQSSNAKELNDAFEKIGADISEAVVRIKR